MRNCPDINNTKLSSWSLSLFLFAFFCPFVFLFFCFFLSFCLLSFCLFLFAFFVLLSFFFWFFSFFLIVFLSRHHADQISEGSQVSQVTLCVKIQKWQSVTFWPRSGIELPGQLKKKKRKNYKKTKTQNKKDKKTKEKDQKESLIWWS